MATNKEGAKTIRYGIELDKFIQQDKKLLGLITDREWALLAAYSFLKERFPNLDEALKVDVGAYLCVHGALKRRSLHEAVSHGVDSGLTSGDRNRELPQVLRGGRRAHSESKAVRP